MWYTGRTASASCIVWCYYAAARYFVSWTDGEYGEMGLPFLSWVFVCCHDRVGTFGAFWEGRTKRTVHGAYVLGAFGFRDLGV